MSDRDARVALSLHAQPDRRTGRLLLAEGPEAAWAHEAARRRERGQSAVDAREVLAAAAALGIRFIGPGDEEWPDGLDSLAAYLDGEGNGADHAAGRDLGEPFGLWVRGRPVGPGAGSVAVVGARAASSYGTAVATDLGTGLAERGWEVVSGAAFGIDAAAHRGALAGGGRTTAVLACGVDVAYPRAHEALLAVLAREGAVVSEAPPGVPPSRGSFLRRNRLIAAMTEGTVLVEAGLRSGARNTVAHTRVLGRPRLVVPGPVTSATSAGCHATLRGDLEAVLVTSAADVVETLGRMGIDLGPHPSGPRDARDDLGGLARAALEALPPHRPLEVGWLATELDAPIADVLAVCAALQVAGLVVTGVDGVGLTDLGRRPTQRAG